MRIAILLVGLQAILVGAQAYNYGVGIGTLTRRQDSGSRIVVKPLPLLRNGTIPLRPEIREMKADQYKWDLFILSLSMFQSVSQDDPTSWYQIAGIHGVPFESWNGVEAAPGANLSGYCMHGSILFPLWHRPYLALFEQELFRMVNVIAGMFPNGTERQAYQDAAHDFRMPYWDWAMDAPEGEEHLPDVFWNATVTQNGPRGVQTIRNPLYAYQFHPKDEGAFIWSPLKNWDETKRAPDTSISDTSPPSNNDQVNAALLSKLPEIQERLFILFSSFKDFNSFGSKAWAVTQNLSTLDSIESIHDIVHTYGGLKGHMTYVPLSSFDPLFLLHHTMTDRLVAMWQTLNPDAWMTPMPASETSFTTPKGDMQDSSTPLTPFFASEDGTFWNSDMARTTGAFGYTYAATGSSSRQGEEFREELMKNITKWYGGSSLAGLQAKYLSAHRHLHEDRFIKPKGERFAGGTPNVRIDAEGPSFELVVKNGRSTAWTANVVVNIEALDGRFSIHFFLGIPSSECSSWLFAKNLIGAVPILGSHQKTGSDAMISGATQMTSSLLKMVAAGEIPNLEPNAVEPFLRETLQFRVLGSNNEEVDPRDVAGLRVVITSAEVTLAEKGLKLPKMGPAVSRIELWPRLGGI
ncbi:hypothetical protein FZEAL_3991 [Fusarium zealandicum]|uniref:tyrosinase n=1 Tax=Fusarium zealandicum TaxID=1053134 RepID=A0A8H4UN72_9HYPO|nr:hypothetical protein FZEAL_3991 [Fusarium zealandicum]